MKTKTQIIILVFCIVVTLSLSAAIYIRGHDNSCNRCQVDFRTTQQSGVQLEDDFVIKVNVTDLYEGLLNDECIIKWDSVQGYYG